MKIEGRYINPFTDFGFKKLFGSELNKELLIDFLNQVLGSREQVKDLNYMNVEQIGAREEERRAVFDLFCENEKGEKFIIELQNVRQEFFKDRCIYYTTFPIQSQVPKGNDWDYELKAVYLIGILNFSFHDLAGVDRFTREVKLVDTQTHEVFYDKYSLLFLEMPKFKKAEHELETHFDKWLYIIKNLHQLQKRPFKLQERVFKRLFQQAEIAKLNSEEMESYQESLKTYRDNYSALKYAKKEGLKEGMEVGIRKGMKEGMKEGRGEGKKEMAIEVAVKLKNKGWSIDEIIEFTGLSAEEIEKL
ncbi:MAG: Rpn family recombination-promoting nuclease/putative transposase [Cyclobacteriaceae bacterium]|nr:PD-(D/E)XK nuclease family transposase [Cyclobacteriaceae bacterium]MCH8517275.1 Rpn family recombination-promoting nuclease/putative transposase [Cyclobacteriaceae bacterium]